jgi:hypothetical protein
MNEMKCKARTSEYDAKGAFANLVLDLEVPADDVV